MIKTKMMKSGFVLIVMTALMGATYASAVETTTDVLVVPARHTIIQLAFDIAALRDVALIAYDQPAPESEEPLLHVWNSSNHAWERLTLDEYTIGAFCNQVPNEMILIGNDSMLPATLITGAAQAETVTRIDTLNLVTVVNTLDKSMKFSPREWKMLARRNNLTIKDQNYERRRWGRYGPPKDENATPEEAEGDLELAPETAEAITETIAIEPVEVEISAVEKGAPVEGMETEESIIDSPIDADTPEVEAPKVEADTTAEDK